MFGKSVRDNQDSSVVGYELDSNGQVLLFGRLDDSGDLIAGLGATDTGSSQGTIGGSSAYLAVG